MLREAVELAPRRRRSVSGIDQRLVGLRTDHLRTLVDDAGIVQHANGVIPNRESGYCVDDVARLAVVALELARRGDEQVWTSIVYRSIAFLQDATVAGAGMRNFMGYDRRWLDEPHLGDHVGRSAWALGEILSTAWVPAVVGPTERLLESIVGLVPPDVVAAHGRLRRPRPRPPRPRPAQPGGPAAARARDGAARGRVQGQRRRGLEVVRERAQLRQRAAPARPDRRRRHPRPPGPDRDRVSRRSAGSETSRAWPQGTLRLTGHGGRHRSEPAPGTGDEQPLDASAFVEAELAAFAVAGDPEHGVRAQRAFDWFLGRNRLHRPLYDFATGGCSDGLGEETTNDNEGAESTLAFHRAALMLDTAGLPAVLRHRTRETTAA